MKRFAVISTVLLALSMRTAAPAAAQGFSKVLKNNGKVGVGFVATHLDGLGKSTSAGPGGELFYSFDLNPNLFVSAGIGYYTVYDNLLKADAFTQTIFPSLELKIGYNVLGASSFSPYVYAGVQGFGSSQTVLATETNTDLGYDGSLIGGAGLHLALSDNLNFFISGDYRYVFSSTAPVKPKHWTAHAGISYSLTPGARKREMIEFPVEEGELALDDLFRTDDGTNSSAARSSTGDEALDALFNTSGNSGQTDDRSAIDALFAEEFGTDDGRSVSDEDDAIALLFAEEESGASLSGAPDTEVGLLMAKVQNLKDDIAYRDSEIESLRQQVQANEQAIASFTRSLAGQYTGMDGTDTFANINAANFKQNYQQALQKHYNRQYNAAIRDFTVLLKAMPEHKLASNCQYWIGESYNAMGEYRRAIDAFNSVLNFRSSYKFDDALIMNGLIQMKTGDKTSARDSFQKLVSEYPDSEYAPKAMRYLGRL